MIENIWQNMYRVIGFVALLVPLLVIPIDVVPFHFTKIVFVIGVVTLVLAVFAVRTVRTGSFSMPWSLPAYGLLALPLTYLISSVFSPSPLQSLFGYQLEFDTFSFILLLSVTAIVVMLTVDSVKKVFFVLIAVLVASWVMMAFQYIQLFFGSPIFHDFFGTPTINLIGKWNDVGLFLSLIVSLVLVSFESFALSKKSAIILYVSLAASLVMTTIVNFALAWILLAIFSFAVTLFSVARFFFSARGEGKRKSVNIPAVIVLIVALFFTFSGTNTSTRIQSSLGIETFEVRPSMEGTRSVLASALAVSPIFGVGPNRFSDAWLLSRPIELVSTPFWNIAFNAGFGTIPTSVVTGGLVVAIGWLLFFGLFLYTAVRALLSIPVTDDRSYILTLIAALGTLFLLLAHVFYVPGQGISLLAFIFFGLFLASLRGTKYSRSISKPFEEYPRLGFVIVFILAIVVISALASTYGSARLYISSIQHSRAVLATQQGDSEAARKFIASAIQYGDNDLYRRTQTAIELGDLRRLIETAGTDEATKEKFQELLGNAILYSQIAVNLNPNAFDNWMTRAAVYGSIVALGIDGAYENTISALEEARLRSPMSPEIDFREAEMMNAKGDSAGAKKAAAASIEKKPDYTPAILLLAQLALNDGRLGDAIQSVQSAAYLEPQNTLLKYQLGLLLLEAKEYTNAAQSLEGALAIDKDYANAQFFLAEAYVFLKRPAEALPLFKALYEKNADSELLKGIITEIEAGRNPFVSEQALPPEEKVAP